MKPSRCWQIRRLLLISSFAMAVTACALPGDLGPDDVVAPPSDVTGTIWLYRVAPRSTPGVWQDIYIDGLRRARAAPGVTRGKLSVGPHVVAIMSNKVRIVVPQDGNVFVRIDVDSAFFGKGIYPVVVDEDTARAELKSLHADVDAPL